MHNFPPGPLGISFGEVTHPGSPSSAELVSKIPGTTASEYNALELEISLSKSALMQSTTLTLLR